MAKEKFMTTLDAETIRNIKVLAALQSRTISDVLTEATADVLRKHKDILKGVL